MWNHKISGYQLPFLVSGSRLKLYSVVLSNKQVMNGLMVHVFGKLAAAMFFWNHLRVSS